MVDSFIYGLALVVGAGACQGSFMLPTKWVKGWVWENYWLVFASTAYLACPWILALATIPRLFEVYEGTSAASLAAIAVYGTGWGFGALTFGLAVEALGLALGFAVILGVAATTGAVVPLLVQPPQGFSFAQGALTASVAGPHGERRRSLFPGGPVEGERRRQILPARAPHSNRLGTPVGLRQSRVRFWLRDHRAGRTAGSAGNAGAERSLDPAYAAAVSVQCGVRAPALAQE